jgi:hypothetical protein
MPRPRSVFGRSVDSYPPAFENAAAVAAGYSERQIYMTLACASRTYNIRFPVPRLHTWCGHKVGDYDVVGDSIMTTIIHNVSRVTSAGSSEELAESHVNKTTRLATEHSESP